MMLDCGDILDIAHIQQWYNSARQQLEGGTVDVTVNVSSLQKIDTAGIQTLVSIVKYVETQGNKVIWSELSPAFTHAATLLGLQNALRITPE